MKDNTPHTCMKKKEIEYEKHYPLHLYLLAQGKCEDNKYKKGQPDEYRGCAHGVTQT